jgi:hypothetical protein
MTPSKDYLIKLGAVGRGEIIEGKCTGCGGNGHERIDRGLLCGCWCAPCFEEAKRKAREKSW